MKNDSPGRVTYNSLLTLLSRNAVVTSRCFMVMWLLKTANVRRTAVMLTNGADVLSKSIPGRCRKPCATNLALYRSISFLALSFFFRIMCVEMSVLSDFTGPSTYSKVLVASSKASSEDVAVFHSSYSRSSMVSNINHRPVSIILAWSFPSLSSFHSLLNCSSFPFLTQFVFSLFLLKFSESCYP